MQEEAQQSSGGSPRGEGRWGPLAGLLSECSWQPKVAADAPPWSGNDGGGIVETAQITHLEFKDLFVLLQSRLSKAAARGRHFGDVRKWRFPLSSRVCERPSREF